MWLTQAVPAPPIRDLQVQGAVSGRTGWGGGLRVDIHWPWASSQPHAKHLISLERKKEKITIHMIEQSLENQAGTRPWIGFSH